MGKDKDFLPWEREEGRKKKLKRGDSIPPKTSISSRVHSKPKIEGQEHLDMYVRSREKERLETYGEILAKRQKSTSEGWKDAKKEMLRKEKEIPEIPKGGIEISEEDTDTKAKQKKTPGHMKKMDWNY